MAGFTKYSTEEPYFPSYPFRMYETFIDQFQFWATLWWSIDFKEPHGADNKCKRLKLTKLKLINDNTERQRSLNFAAISVRITNWYFIIYCDDSLDKLTRDGTYVNSMILFTAVVVKTSYDALQCGHVMNR